MNMCPHPNYRVCYDTRPKVITLLYILCMYLKIPIYIVGFPTIYTFILLNCFLCLFSFSFDPTERTTFWVMFIGGAFAILPLWSVNQTAVQRFLSAKSLKEAQR